MSLKKAVKKTDKKSDLLYLFLPAITVFVLFRFILFHGTVPTGSMVPTIPEHSNFIGSQLTYKFSEPQKGDVIFFEKNLADTEGKDGNMLLVKRIVATEGQVVLIYGDDTNPSTKVYKSLDAYNADTAKPAGKALEVPEDSVFVRGDNSQNSYDSRYWPDPFVKYSSIKGKALFGYQFKPKFKVYGIK